MKLIKEGHKEPKVYRATCKYCGAVWEAQAREVEGFYRNEIVLYTRTCEECGTYGLQFKVYNGEN